MTLSGTPRLLLQGWRGWGVGQKSWAGPQQKTGGGQPGGGARGGGTPDAPHRWSRHPPTSAGAPSPSSGELTLLPLQGICPQARGVPISDPLPFTHPSIKKTLKKFHNTMKQYFSYYMQSALLCPSSPPTSRINLRFYSISRASPHPVLPSPGLLLT